MTYYADLTKYVYSTNPKVPNCYNVGWLDKSMPFEKGKVPAEFLDTLLTYCLTPVVETRGIHHCNLCEPETVVTQKFEDFDILLGTSEIRVFTEKNVFAAPTLIYHYVAEHDYLPPQCFIDAVLDSGSLRENEYSQTLEHWGYK